MLERHVQGGERRRDLPPHLPRGRAAQLYKKYFTRSGKLLGSLTGADIDLDWKTIARLGDGHRCNPAAARRRCTRWGWDTARSARYQQMGLALTPASKGTQLAAEDGFHGPHGGRPCWTRWSSSRRTAYERTGRKIKFLARQEEGRRRAAFHNAGASSWPGPENILPTRRASTDAQHRRGGLRQRELRIWYDDAQAKNVAMAQFEAARKQGVKRIVIGECGQAHKAAVVGADRMADSEERGVPRGGWPSSATSPKFDSFRRTTSWSAPARSVQDRARWASWSLSEILRRYRHPTGYNTAAEAAVVRHQRTPNFTPHEGERAHEVRPDTNAFADEMENPDMQ